MTRLASSLTLVFFAVACGGTALTDALGSGSSAATGAGSGSDGGAGGGPGGPGGCGPHGPPPQEAIDACTGKAVGDACSFALGGQTLTGKCVAPPPNAPAGAAAACLPDRPPGPPQGPPPEAIEACKGKAAGDDCSVTHDGRTLNGKCVPPPPNAPAGAPLACLPPPPPPPQEAIDACTGKAVGDACSVTHDGHTVDGKCVTPPPGAPAGAPVACLLPPPPPPQEAIDACAGKAVGDDCTVTLDGHSLGGKCVAPPPEAPAGAPIACLPPPPPGPPQGP